MNTRAPTFTEKGPAGNERERCVLCNKVAKKSEQEARDACERIWQERQVYMRYYKGPCGHWHLTRTRSRKFH